MAEVTGPKHFMFALDPSNGTVRCWGDNGYGQLGNGTFTISSSPVQVSAISTATQISAGGSHTCALLSDGTVRCWGYNGYGELGNSSTTHRYRSSVSLESPPSVRFVVRNSKSVVSPRSSSR